jgi:hydrogenase maturation protease
MTTQRDTSSAPRVLVLGYGNPGRQDDGLGPAAATWIGGLGWPNLTAFDNYQLNIEDAMDVADHDIVWFVDAARTGPAPFAVHDLEPAAGIAFTSHIVSPETILAIAGQYFGRVPKASLLAIRGYEFAFVESLTEAAADNLRDAQTMLAEWILSTTSSVAP